MAPIRHCAPFPFTPRWPSDLSQDESPWLAATQNFNIAMDAEAVAGAMI